MRILPAILVLLTISTFVDAREYKNMSAYKRITGNTELNKRDWLTKHRKNNTREWLEACAFNFSYATGYFEYQDTKQRRDFYLWLQNELKKKGHEVYWPAMAAEISHQARKVYGKGNKIGEFARIASKTVFDSSFSRLQAFYQQAEVLKGADAVLWDKAMIEFEQRELVQPIYNRMDARTLKKLNNIANRKGLAALKVPARLQFSGDLKKPEDRIQYAENVLLPYVKGEPVIKKARSENKEPEEITEDKEEKGEKKETKMEKNLVKDSKKAARRAKKDRKAEEKRIARWNKRELKLDVKAIERSAVDPNAY